MHASSLALALPCPAVPLPTVPQGELQVLASDAGPLLYRVAEGTVFGESSIVRQLEGTEKVKRRESVQCRVPCDMLKLPAEDALDLCEHYPELLRCAALRACLLPCVGCGHVVIVVGPVCVCVCVCARPCHPPLTAAASHCSARTLAPRSDHRRTHIAHR